MSDFLKIFLVLCGLVAAFVFGRNYGEENFKQSEEYRSLIKTKEEQNFLTNDLQNAKTKFQNILDTAETKKTDELLAQILQVFLADLGLRIQDQKNFIKPAEAPKPVQQVPATPVPQTNAKNETKEVAKKREKAYDYKKLKSYEWILQNSRNNQDIKRNLKNVEIKNIDTFLKNAKEATPDMQDSLFGSYRGRILDQLQNEYGTLLFEVFPVPDTQPLAVKGNLKIFRSGKETSTQQFKTTQLGFFIEGHDGFILNMGTTYYQIYKIQETQQLAGYYYERLSNGTTNTIGTFVLNRVDQF